ncbi:hypothetical protein F2Q70_00005609 [Brassica cretica]|uniref:Uncharacterized protein n=1 Tax=Brassica cretica TaxID=69181 RepID=A0A8S9IYS9_BRACR|nr:hypothetical protein F2Q70_00005609 [Brassica cretica]
MEEKNQNTINFGILTKLILHSLVVRWNVPTGGEAEWRINLEEREIVVERTDERNNVRVAYLVFSDGY